MRSDPRTRRCVDSGVTGVTLQTPPVIPPRRRKLPKSRPRIHRLGRHAPCFPRGLRRGTGSRALGAPFRYAGQGPPPRSRFAILRRSLGGSMATTMSRLSDSAPPRDSTRVASSQSTPTLTVGRLSLCITLAPSSPSRRTRGSSNDLPSLDRAARGDRRDRRHGPAERRNRNGHGGGRPSDPLHRPARRTPLPCREPRLVPRATDRGRALRP